MPRTPYATPGTEAAGATPVYEGLKAQMGMVPNVAGWSDEEISRIGPGAGRDSAFGNRERAVARFAEEATRSVVASDEAVTAMTEQLSAAELSDIAFTVAAANLVQRVGNNLGAELEF